MEKEHQKNIETIISEISCTKNVQCYTSGFKNLCKAKVVGSDSHLECLEENPKRCSFSQSVGAFHYCRCPLRSYLLKNLKI